MVLNSKMILSKNIFPLPCANHSGPDTDLNSALQNLTDDTILELEKGEHCIFNYTLIQDLHNVTIRGVSRNTSLIRCTNGNGLAFFNVSELTIESVTVLNCGLDNETFNDFTRVVRDTIEFFFHISEEPDNYIAVACANCVNFTLRNAEIKNTAGLGFLGINLLGNSTISNTHFTGNIPDGCSHSDSGSKKDIKQTEKTGGGAIIVYHDYVERKQHRGHCHLHIDQATFFNNSYCGIQGVYELHLFSHTSDDDSMKENFVLGEGGGLSIILTQIHYHVKALVENSLFMKNRAGYGGGANVEIFTAVFDSHVMFRGCNFTNNGPDNVDHVIDTSVDYVTVGSGIGFISDILQPSFNRSVDIDPDIDLVPCTVNIIQSNFIENYAYSGGAIFIISLYAPLLGGTLQEELRIESCVFERNLGVVGGAVYAHEWKQSPFQQGLDIVFHDVTFDSNIVHGTNAVSATVLKSAVIDILSLNVTFSGENFIRNSEGTGLSGSSSTIIFKDSIEFYNNQGSYGGALRLEAESFLLLNDNTHIVFRENVGTIFGGAVYVSYTTVSPSLSQVDCSFYFGPLNFHCFSTIHSNCPDITKYNTTVRFEKNTAPLGGMVYGSTLEACPWAKRLIQTYAPNNSNLTLFEIFYKADIGELNFTSPFSFDKPPNSTAEVSTSTGRIVVNASEIIAVPGQTLEIGIQALDKFNRSVPTILTTLPSLAGSQNITTLMGGSDYYLLQQESNDLNNNTVPANLTFFGNENVDKMNISLFSLLSLSQTQFTITLTNCTEGFTYVEERHACECSDVFDNTTIECNDNDFTLVVPTELWVGQGPDGVLVVANCHFDFCLNGRRTIQPPNYDQQCQTKYNRSGITCGQCVVGYSLMLGSNRCGKCENRFHFVALIVVFALLGIILVSALSFLQMTVSEGYLNGMLFYANVLNIYLPLMTNSNSNVAFIFILVSFLNLNLGIETCFYDGMDALARTGLYLVFPFYIFLLMFVIVGISSRSARFSNWCTRNGFSASKVFVTLIVMTYSSLLETCIEVLGFDHIGNHLLWRMDNNQKYFGGSHIALGLLAIFLLCFLLALPFLLLLEGKLFKYRVFGRYKPLYDAVWAPFRTKYRFWVGLRLLLRGFPFIFIYFLSRPVNILLLAMFLVALLWIQGMLKPFRGFARNAFDTFFLSNLIILVLGALYFYIYWAQLEIKNTTADISSLDSHKKAFYSIVVGMAYIAFLLIIFWHLALRFPRIMKFLNTVNRHFKALFSSKSDRRLKNFITDVKKKTSPSQYGAIANDHDTTSSDQEQSSDEANEYDSSKVVHERKAIVTYSQWREPLLSSGSLEIETIDKDDDKKA